MKKFFSLVFIGTLALSANAQYQLQNAGFEDWEDVSYSYKSFLSTKTVSGQEPVNWNSFIDGSGSLKNSAVANQVASNSDVRPGTTGSKSAKITARSVMGVVAQGNLTTGCVNMGNITASNADGNYNYTDTETEGKNQKFTGMPDAMHVWVKFSGSKTAKAVTILHTDGYYQDPYGNSSKITATKVAEASNTSIASDASNWQELTIPFTYSTTTRPAYALVTFSTSSTPGEGAASDYMYIDDVEYLYYHALTDLKYNGTTISGFSETQLGYTLKDQVYDASKLSYTKKGVGATVETDYDASTGKLTISVKGDDYESNNSSITKYTIQFKNRLVLTDTEAPTLTGKFHEIVVKRAFKKGWNTICLPFACKPTDIHSSAKAQYLSEEANGVLKFKDLTDKGSFIANKPYLIWLPEAMDGFTYTPSNTKSISSFEFKDWTAGDFTFRGTYESIPMNGYYGVADVDGVQKLMLGGSSSTIKGLRGYFIKSGSQASTYAIELEGETTGIIDVRGEVTEDGAVFNLQGIRVANSVKNLPAGLYIVNGRKVLVK